MPDKKPVKLFADYEEYAKKQAEEGAAPAYSPERMSDQDAKTAMETGESPEYVAMVNRLVSAGLAPSLAIIAVKQMMGVGGESEWDTYSKAHPVMANSKKLLAKGAAPLRAGASALAAPVRTGDKIKGDAEKVSAHRMLKEYLQAQDMQRMNDAEKEGLWMVARMPGAPLAGQPVYGGPMTAPAPTQPPMVNMPDDVLRPPVSALGPLPGEMAKQAINPNRRY